MALIENSQLWSALLASAFALVGSVYVAWQNRRHAREIEILRSNLEQQKLESNLRAEQHAEQFKSYLARLMDGGERESTAFKTILHDAQKVRDAARQVLRCTDEKTLKTCTDQLEKARISILDAFADHQIAFSDKADRDFAHKLKAHCDQAAAEVISHFRLAPKDRATIPPELAERIENLGALHSAFRELARKATERFLVSLKPTDK
jgi:HAMP domain-containing protein